MTLIAEHDIVQIVDTTHAWYPALLIVTEVKSWGVQAVCLIPQSNAEPDVALAFIRLRSEQIERVGRAVVTRMLDVE